MKILYAGMKYDYGIKERGLSFEHYNFYECLNRLDIEICYFDYMSEMQQHGKRAMNKALLRKVQEEAPDLLFTVLFEDEIEKRTLEYITENTETITLNWFCDDHWRFENYSRFYAPCFDYVITTSNTALKKYKDIDYKNVIKSQWACNHFLYMKLDLPLQYDLTFVGQPHSDRRQIITSIGEKGIRIDVWGNGWNRGKLSQEDMIKVFNQSKINLNLSNSSVPITIPCTTFGKYREQATEIARRMPLGRSFITSIGKIKDNNNKCRYSLAKPDRDLKTYTEQIKGRNFEVPGCGGFVLSSAVDDLDRYFRIGKEVVCYTDVPDLIEKARYYLNNEEERKAIADAGYRRTLNEHTYLHRFKDIFSHMGLEDRSLDSLIKGTTSDVGVESA